MKTKTTFFLASAFSMLAGLALFRYLCLSVNLTELYGAFVILTPIVLGIAFVVLVLASSVFWIKKGWEFGKPRKHVRFL